MRPIDDITGGKLVTARLKKRRRRFRGQNRKNGADRDVCIEVGGVVEGIDVDGKRRSRIERHSHFIALRTHPGDRGNPQRVGDDLAAEETQLFLSVPIQGVGPLRRHVARQRTERDKARDFDAGLGGIRNCFRDRATLRVVARPLRQMVTQCGISAHAVYLPCRSLTQRYFYFVGSAVTDNYWYYE